MPRWPKRLTEEEKLERRKKYNREYYEKNKDWIDYNHDCWRKNNALHLYITRHEYYLKNKDKFIAARKRYLEKQRQKKKEIV